MAQSITNLTEIDTSSDAGFEFSFKWPVRTKEAINAFVKCAPNKKLTSAVTTNSFSFKGEKINFDWYVEAYPNGGSWKGAANFFIVATRVHDMPRATTVDIKALTMTHSISIPDLHIFNKFSNKFSEQTYLGWKTIDPNHNIKNDVFTKYNVAKHGGFDIIAQRYNDLDF